VRERATTATATATTESNNRASTTTNREKDDEIMQHSMQSKFVSKKQSNWGTPSRQQQLLCFHQSRLLLT
jgi:hypothetical protein